MDFKIKTTTKTKNALHNDNGISSRRGYSIHKDMYTQYRNA